MLILKVSNINTDILGNINSPDFISKFVSLRNKLSFRPEGYLFSPKYKRKQWDGWKRLAWRNTKRCYFPTGLLSMAKQHFDEHDIPYRIIDARKKPVQDFITDYNTENYALRDYQKQIVDIAVKKSRGIIMAPTGCGKTIIGAGIIHECKVKPFLFLVTSIDLLEQTRERLESILFRNGTNEKIGTIGGGQVDIRDINVMTVQTAVRALGKKFIKFDSESQDDKISKSMLQKYRKEIVEVMKNAKGVISDEVQHWRSDMCQIVTKFLENAYFRFGTSATPWRDQGDDILIHSCFGKTICQIKASELIKKGYLVKPEINFIHINPAPSKYKNWQNIYKERVVEDQHYNSLIANIATEYIKMDRLILILVQQIEHGKTLEQMIDGSLFVYGNSSKKERISALNKLRNGYIKCIIATSLFDEGIDCQALNTLILTGQGKMATRAMQRVGRALRTYKGKTSATIIDFFIHERYLEQHAKAREKMYKSEEEFVIKHSFLE